MLIRIQPRAASLRCAALNCARAKQRPTVIVTGRPTLGEDLAEPQGCSPGRHDRHRRRRIHRVRRTCTRRRLEHTSCMGLGMHACTGGGVACQRVLLCASGVPRRAWRGVAWCGVAWRGVAWRWCRCRSRSVDHDQCVCARVCTAWMVANDACTRQVHLRVGDRRHGQPPWLRRPPAHARQVNHITIATP